jgi:hypothetical protein
MNMDFQRQRDRLLAELQTRGLPQAYIARLLSELDDHFTDLVQERNLDMSTARMPDCSVDDLAERLGSPTQLAIFAAEQYRSRSFFGRHPILTFLFGPLPLLVAMWIAACLAIAGVMCAIAGVAYVVEHVFNVPLLSMPPEDHPWLEAIPLAIVSWVLIVFPPLIAAWWLCQTAARNALNWHWPVLSCSLVAMVAAVFAFSYRLTPPGGHGLVMVGFDLDASLSWFCLKFLPKFTMALGIGVALVWRERSRGDGHISDTPATVSTRRAA